MKSIQEYTELRDVLLKLKLQVIDSLPYAKKIIPAFDSPGDLFVWLRERVIYKSDPRDRELLMSLETFATGSRTGIQWAGDCDDFTISALAALYVNHFKPLYVILVGRKKTVPVHIYAGVEDGGIVPFDLTNPYYGYERDEYKFQQILPFSI